MQTQKSVFTNTLIVAIVLLLLFFCALYGGWFGPGTDVGGAFCEAARDSIIKQPANTWSNLGFIFFGLLMAWQISKGKFNSNSNRFTQSVFTATFFSCLVVFLGPGSMAMHASETEIGGELDMLSMYLIASFAASYAMQRYFNWSNQTFTISFILIILSCEMAGRYHGHIPVVGYAGNLSFAIFIVVCIVFEFLNTYHRKLLLQKKYGFMSLGLLLLAFFVWNIWQDGSTLCNPKSLIQGHAIWHLLDSAAAYFLFRFYVSEHSLQTN